MVTRWLVPLWMRAHPERKSAGSMSRALLRINSHLDQRASRDGLESRDNEVGTIDDDTDGAVISQGGVVRSGPQQIEGVGNRVVGVFPNDHVLALTDGGLITDDVD